MRLAALIFVCFAGAAWAQTADSVVSPTGEGGPDKVTCRAPRMLPGSRLLGPRVCRSNATWARYHRDGMDIAPDGIHDTADEKYRSSHPQSCHAGGGGPSGTSMATGLGMTCE